MKPKKKVSNVSSLLIKKKPTRTRVIKLKQDDAVPLEFDEQVRFVAYCNSHQDKRLSLIYSHINGVFISARQGAKLAMAGAKAGIPDLFLPVPSGIWHGCYIELKRKCKGVVSAKQKEWIASLQAQGYCVHVCKGCDEAIAVIKNYLNIK